MMRIDPRDLGSFWTIDGEHLRITPLQASRFAKEIAGDWNPIHDVGAKRYCVPGDLLFAVVLSRYGLRQRMAFRFEDMVGEGQVLRLPAPPSEATGGAGADAEAALILADVAGKPCLSVTLGGACSHDAVATEAFIRRYVSFSGRNFPHFLQPLMAEQGVMFNLDRPLVIYDSMAFALSAPVPAAGLDLELSGRGLEVQGRRAVATLEFRISADGESIGEGRKRLLVGGLQAYDGERVQAFIDRYRGRMSRYAPEG
jgi:hypothetical protein